MRSLKGNQTRLHADIRAFFADAQAHAFHGLPHTTAETVDGDHGRIETRRAWATDDVAWLANRRRWPGLRRVVCVEATRTVGDQTTREPRFVISSLAPGAAHLARIVRSHWAIENSLHWVLDVAMHQDQTRVRTGYAPEIKNTRLAAGWDHDDLLRVIMGAEHQIRLPRVVAVRPLTFGGPCFIVSR